jgi:flagellar assembly factor FliW
MIVQSKAFGPVEISDKQRIIFKEGIFGFEDIHQFVLLDTDFGSPFYWLQSEEIKEIAFLIIDPKMIVSDYELDVSKEEIEEIDTDTKEDLLIFSIVTINENPEKTTVNLLGPLVINRKTRMAKQVISNNDKYTVRFPLIQKKAD